MHKHKIKQVLIIIPFMTRTVLHMTTHHHSLKSIITVKIKSILYWARIWIRTKSQSSIWIQMRKKCHRYTKLSQVWKSILTKTNVQDGIHTPKRVEILSISVKAVVLAVVPADIDQVQYQRTLAGKSTIMETAIVITSSMMIFNQASKAVPKSNQASPNFGQPTNSLCPNMVAIICIMISLENVLAPVPLN